MSLLNFNPQVMGLLGDTLAGVGIGLLNQQPSNQPISLLGNLGGGLQYAQGLQQQRRSNQRMEEAQKIAQQQLAIQQQTAAQQKAAFDQQQQQLAAKKAAAQSMFGGQSIPSNPMAFPAGAPPAGSSVGVTQPSQAFANLSHSQLAALQQYSAADPDGAMSIALQQAFPKPSESPATVKEYEYAVGQGYQGTLNDFIQQKARAGANSTTINMPPAEKAFQTNLGTAGGKAAGDLLYATVPAAQSQINNLDALKGAVASLEAAGGDVGKLAPLQKTATELMQAFNLDPQTLGLPSDAGPAQAITAITNRLALEARSTGDGTGMPGAMSDADRVFLQQSVPSIADTPAGLKMKIEIAERLAKRRIEAAQEWAKYPKTEDGWTKFQFDWIKYNQQNPVFGKTDQEKVQALTGQAPAPAKPKPSAAPGPTGLPGDPGDWN